MDGHASFGAWVQRRRRALDLTQAELAERVGCALGTIRKIETDERRPSKQLAARLADQLQLAPASRAVFLKAARAELAADQLESVQPSLKAPGLLHEGVARSPLPALGSQLPAQPTPFIGRSRDLGEVRRLLGRSRLLTLTGTGGTGKTRLAMEAAEVAAAAFADGVCFVDLAPLADHTVVAQAVARALGVVETPAEPVLDTLKRALAQRDVLLLLDNFEHVIRAAPLVSALLAAAPRVKALVTSRASLRLAGEQEYPVPPLTLPDANAVSAQMIAASEAGALFVQRAQMALPHFVVSDANATTIARICIRLDGLPLAIELAAARCKLLTPQALLARLEGQAKESPFQALADGSRDAPLRHRTLRDTLAWSYNLLDADEQTLFARLAVFQGGRSLDAIEAVCGADLLIDVYDGLASLVDKSLVQQKEGPGGEPSFRLLELIQAYARERLEASGQVAILRVRHAEYIVALAERAEPELRLAGYDRWCEVFEFELDNIRAVLQWTLNTGDVTLGVRLASAVGLFWYGKGYHVEGLRWTQQFLARLDEAPLPYHPKFLVSAAHLAWFHDLDTARCLLTRALDISRELNDVLQAAWARTFLGYVMLHEPEAAMPIVEAGLATFRALEHQPGIAQALNIIGEVARVNGDDARAREAYEECLAVCQHTGEARRIGYLCGNLAFLAQHAGDYERAMELGRQGLQLARERQDGRDMAEKMITIAGSMGVSSASRAAQLLGAANALFERLGSFFPPSDMPENDRIVAGVRRHLDDAAFHAAWAEGRSTTLEQAIAFALE